MNGRPKTGARTAVIALGVVACLVAMPFGGVGTAEVRALGTGERLSAQYPDFDTDFYYDPGSPCYLTNCDGDYYMPSDDYFYDPGSPCDASICDEGYYDPTDDFYYDPGSDTDSNLIDTSDYDWSDPATVAARLTAPGPNPQDPRYAAPLSGPHAAKPPVRTFVDNARSYKLVYPNNWSLLKRPSIEFAVEAPDANAMVEAQAVSVPQAETFTLGDVLPSFFAAMGGVPESTSYQAVPYLGDTREVAKVMFHWAASGTPGGTVLVLVHNHGREYLVAGLVANLNSTTAASDALHVSSVVSSLDLLHVMVVPKSLSAHFTDRTHSYTLTYATDWTRGKTAPNVDDLVLQAPDNEAAIVTLSRAQPKGVGNITDSEMRGLVTDLSAQVGKLAGLPVYHTVIYQGVARHTVSFAYKTSKGLTGHMFVIAALHHARVCVVGGIYMDTTTARADRDGARVSAMLSSLRFA
jgi:hypothetical protein